MPSTTSCNPIHFFVVSPAVESASSSTSKDRSQSHSVLSALVRVFIAVVVVSAFTICVTFSSSLLLSSVGATLLGLAKNSGTLYTGITLMPLVVVTACGAAVITAACVALVLLLAPASMCSDGGMVLNGFTALSGGFGAGFFAPAIGIALTKGHVVGQSIELTAKQAMKMNGVGLGGAVACSVVLWICASMATMAGLVKASKDS
uniref:Uncharacterized protein n=1 Tax=Ganoderma boninense TaxID=34458 RepID=A0A5K1JTB6_9APHY|nr:Uncharacterized protein [Ganoderma boninense]